MRLMKTDEKIHLNNSGYLIVEGATVKSDERYEVIDNNVLKNLVVSSTRLNPMKATTGHKHEGQEEVYMFIEGGGRMQLDDEEFTVSGGSIVYIQDGVFHRVTAGIDGLYFVCVFDGRRNHE